MHVKYTDKHVNSAARVAAGCLCIAGKNMSQASLLELRLHDCLCCLHFSFLLGCVRNIHHCCFCISVHCETRQREKSKNMRYSKQRCEPHLHTRTHTSQVFVVAIGESDTCPGSRGDPESHLSV